jgi:3,4-dihydroxy 2-butanone 4-phosphate synthase/GTP cyclohydrolase II
VAGYNFAGRRYGTVDANLMLGHAADERDYTPAAFILRDLGVRSVRLLTNNPAKVEALRVLRIPVAERVPLLPTVQQFNRNYLDTKARRMRHWLDAALTGGNGRSDGETATGAASPRPRQPRSWSISIDHV